MKRRTASISLVGKMRLGLFGVGAVCIVASSVVFYGLWSRQTVDRNLQELQRQVQVVASGIAVSDTLPGSDEDEGAVRERLLKVEAGLLGTRLSVTSATGTVLFSTAGEAAVATYDISLLRKTGGGFDPRTALVDSADVGKVAVTAVPVAFREDGDPSRYLVGARPLEDLRSGSTWVLASIAGSSIVGLIVAWLFGGWLANRITRPIRELTDGALAVAEGEWGRQVAVTGDDEVARLAGAFNEMSERVAAAYLAQRGFVADVSHELRTPVASIRGFANAITDGVVSDSAGIMRAAEVIGAEASRLGELTTTLLALAELDAGTVVFESELIDVDALVDAMRDRFAGPAAAAGVELAFERAEGAPRGDGARLLQAASALIDNAIRHSPAGGRVRISLGGPADAGRWHLVVEDSGPGIPEEERERVFGRFTRLDGSRSKESGGTGLGLAICRRLIELSGGRVWADASSDLGGARMTIEMPCADST